jgi:hypothetical protein
MLGTPLSYNQRNCKTEFQELPLLHGKTLSFFFHFDLESKGNPLDHLASAQTRMTSEFVQLAGVKVVP